MPSRPLIPRDKPKAWILMTAGILAALILGGPTMLLGYYLDVHFVALVGLAIFYTGWLLGISMAIVFVYGFLRGKYVRLEGREWSAQVW